MAGNHDWVVFPRILDQLNTPLFHFLGQGSRREETYLERDGQQLLRIAVVGGSDNQLSTRRLQPGQQFFKSRKFHRLDYMEVEPCFLAVTDKR